VGTSAGQRWLLRAVRAATTVSFAFTLRHMRHAMWWSFRGPLDDVLRTDEPVIVTGWHQDVLALMHYLCTHTFLERRRRFTMLASRSFDGEVTEQVVRPFGFRFVRGSSGKAGARAALHGLRHALERGGSVVVVADGPGPPAWRFHPGPIFLARSTGVPLYVARVQARPQWIVPRTWFRMTVPFPRAHCALFSAGPIDVSDGVEQGRARAEETLLRLGREVDAHLYLRRRPPEGIRLADRGV